MTKRKLLVLLAQAIVVGFASVETHAQESVIAEKTAIREFFERLIAAARAQTLLDPRKLEKAWGVELFAWEEFDSRDYNWRNAKICTGLAYFDSEPKRPQLEYRLRAKGDSLRAGIRIDVGCKSPFPSIGDLFEKSEFGTHIHGMPFSTFSSVFQEGKSGVRATYTGDCGFSVTAWQGDD